MSNNVWNVGHMFIVNFIVFFYTFTAVYLRKKKLFLVLLDHEASF